MPKKKKGPVIKVRTANHGDIARMAPHVREADRQELWAIGYMTPEKALTEGLRMSKFAYTGTVDGRPAVMFGVCDGAVLGGLGNVWLIGTDEIEQNALTFLYESPKYLRKMQKRYEMLTNYIDARNKVAIRWLRWLGFSFDDAEPMGPFKVPFHRFWLKGELSYV